MARIDLEDFGDTETARIYIAGTLAEAKRVEVLLSENGVHYAVEVEPYQTFGIFSIFSSKQAGASFYVALGQADFCRRSLRDAGLKVGIIEDSLS